MNRVWGPTATCRRRQRRPEQARFRDFRLPWLPPRSVLILRVTVDHVQQLVGQPGIEVLQGVLLFQREPFVADAQVRTTEIEVGLGVLLICLDGVLRNSRWLGRTFPPGGRLCPSGPGSPPRRGPIPWPSGTPASLRRTCRRWTRPAPATDGHSPNEAGSSALCGTRQSPRRTSLDRSTLCPCRAAHRNCSDPGPAPPDRTPWPPASAPSRHTHCPACTWAWHRRA